MEHDRGDVERAYELGLDQIANGEYFAAHELLEEAWRAAETDGDTDGRLEGGA